MHDIAFWVGSVFIATCGIFGVIFLVCLCSGCAARLVIQHYGGWKDFNEFRQLKHFTKSDPDYLVSKWDE